MNYPKTFYKRFIAVPVQHFKLKFKHQLNVALILPDMSLSENKAVKTLKKVKKRCKWKKTFSCIIENYK